MDRMFAFFAAILFTALTVSSASLAAPAGVAPFDSVSLEAGGEVVVRPGAVHSVRVVRGDPRALEITTRRNSLRIRCRPNACRNSVPRVEVTSPSPIRALAVNGGGRLRVERGFGHQRDLALAVRGGGEIDALRLSAASVAAAISGGGNIQTHARSSLAATIRGGGLVSYLGDPSVTSAIQGGGAVRMAASGNR